MNEVYVFDIATSMWYRQATSGTTPNIRVNPCAVVAAAADGSSHNIHMFGGQNLIPYNNQTQYNDMWILSIPSFTWISVDMSSQSVPYPRAGHTCNIWDSQMVLAGGYIGPDISCEAPGIYIFNLSSLSWQNQFTSLGSAAKDNPFSQQLSQKGVGAKAGLDGSYGYQVPPAVISVIGGNGNGHATVTKPVQTATSGPLASGTSITYVIPGENGTSSSGGNNGSGGGGSSNGGGSSGSKIGIIIASVFAALLALLACYLGFCAWVYRKQRNMARRHINVAQDQQMSSSGAFFALRNMPGGNKAGGRSSLVGPYHHRASDSVDTTTHGNSSEFDRRSDSSESLIAGLQTSFLGIVMHPKEALRVVNANANDAL